MNDPAEHENDAVSSLLEALRPAAPSPELLSRLSAARPIARTVVPRSAKIIAFIPRLSMAAALIALAGAIAWKFLPAAGEDLVADSTPAAGEPASPPLATAVLAPAVLAPAQSRQRLIGWQDLGVARDEQSRPVRYVRAQWLDDETYLQPNGAPPLRQERVREEIVPVTVHTY